MPAHRDRDGAVVDDHTQVTQRGEGQAAPGQPSHNPDDSVPVGSRGKAADTTQGPPEPSHYDEPTRLYQRRQGNSHHDDVATILQRPGGQANQARDTESMADPVTGWLVVTKGPGKGHTLPLGLGRNEVGRAATAKVVLDFGDGQVSRNAHAYVTYDDEARDWYIQQGGGRNLVRLDDRPVLEPTSLPARSVIRIGATHLLFIPLCGKDFDWEDVAE